MSETVWKCLKIHEADYNRLVELCEGESPGKPRVKYAAMVAHLIKQAHRKMKNRIYRRKAAAAKRRAEEDQR